MGTFDGQFLLDRENEGETGFPEEQRHVWVRGR